MESNSNKTEWKIIFMIFAVMKQFKHCNVCLKNNEVWMGTEPMVIIVLYTYMLFTGLAWSGEGKLCPRS